MGISILRTAEQYIREVERTTEGWPKDRIIESLEGQLKIAPHYVTMSEEEREKAIEYLSKKLEKLKS